MQQSTRNKISLLIKCYLKYIRPSGATANEIAEFINNDDFGLNHVMINSNVVRGVISSHRHTTDLLYHRIDKDKKWKTGCGYTYRWVGQ